MIPEPTDSPDETKRALLPGPLIVSVLTLVAVLVTLDPASSRPGLPQGPGITLDESFNVQMGVYLVESLRNYGLGMLDPQSLEEIFGNPAYNPDHPPIGRLWLGVFHKLSRTMAPINSGDHPFVTIHARAGSAIAFSLTVLLTGVFVTRRWGQLAGVTSSVCLAVMPRAFGHAHLASLETFMGLTWTLAVLGTIHVWTRHAGSNAGNDQDSESDSHSLTVTPDDRNSMLNGLLIGLALLTKMQAILLPPLIFVWAIWHWGHSAIRPLLVTLTSTAIVFFAGWPWLWLDFPTHPAEYFGRTTGRISLNVWYLGQVFQDVDTPWHYPWIMTLVTVPLGTTGLAAFGTWKNRHRLLRTPATGLVLGSVIAPLVLFSLPGVAVYDGARLFLVVCPGIAILAGIGAVPVTDWLRERKLSVRVIFGSFLALQCIGITTTSPYYLSYYNAAVGGTRGAAWLGFETTYWGDSFSRRFLDKLKSTAGVNVVQVAPVLHQFQLRELEQQASFQPQPAEPPLRLAPWGSDWKTLRPDSGLVPDSDDSPEYLAVFHRRADAPSRESLRQRGWEFVDSVRCQGVDVASLWRRAVVGR